MNKKFAINRKKKVKRSSIVHISISFLLLLYLTVFISFPASAVNNELADISEHWAKQSIQYLNNLRIIKGYPDNTFKPENLMTRGEFASALCNLLKETPVVQPTFKDIPKEHWAGKYVGALQRKEIIWNEESYLNEGYGIDGNITRMEIVKMIIRTNPKAVEVTKNEEVYYSLTRFTDYYNLDEETKRYVGILYSSQIISGFPDNTFKLNQPATRAEIVTLLEKFIGNRDKLDSPNTPMKPKTGIVGNMFYVDKLELPQYLRAYNQIRNITDEELPLKYRVDRVSIFNYDTYNEETPGYSPEYKDLMERYQVLWKKLKEEGNLDWYNNNIAAYQPDEIKDIANKNILAVDYTVENTTQNLFAMQSKMVAPKLLSQKEFDDINWMNRFLDFNIIIFDSFQIEQWENRLRLNGDWSDKKSYKITAFYYLDYKNNINRYDTTYEYKAVNLQDIKYIGFYNPGNWLYDNEAKKSSQMREQALLMKLEE